MTLDIQNTKPDNIREVVAPIPMTQIQEYLKNKDIVFIFKYSESVKLKGSMLLTYLANLDVPAEIILDVPKEQKFELLKDYMMSFNINNLHSLACLTAAALLVRKGCSEDDLRMCFSYLALSVDELKEFNELNKEMLDRWEITFDSMSIYLQTCIKEFEQAFGSYDEAYEVIDDANYIGKNFVNLFSVDLFLDVYFSLIKGNTNFRYLKKQFNDYMFARKNLFHYVENAKSPMLWLLMGVASGDIKYDDIASLDNDFPQEKRVFKKPLVTKGLKELPYQKKIAKKKNKEKNKFNNKMMRIIKKGKFGQLSNRQKSKGRK